MAFDWHESEGDGTLRRKKTVPKTGIDADEKFAETISQLLLTAISVYTREGERTRD